jgi:hypothetical protein
MQHNTSDSLVIVFILAMLLTCNPSQAILHFQNLPTLPMLTAVSWCLKTSVLLSRSKERRSQIEIARLLVTILACVGILVVEYRLLVAGLITAILALGLDGIARALRQVIFEQMPETFDTRRANILLCGAGLVITGTTAAYNAGESWGRFFYALKREQLPLVALNALATAIAMLMGHSLFFPVDEADGNSRKVPAEHSWSHVAIPTLMVGSIGLASTLRLRRSYMSWYQFSFFLLSMLCMAGASNLNIWYKPKAYESVPNADLDVVELDGGLCLEDPGALQVAEEKRRWRIVLQRYILGLVILPAVWIPYQMFNFSEKINGAPTQVYPSLDRWYTPEIAVEVVISMYKEPVGDVATLISTLKAMPNLQESEVHIYVKDGEADTRQIRDRTGADKVTALSNIGREGETYLYHILNNWDVLARHTVFLQADVHNPREFYPRIRNYFHPRLTGMLNLGWSGNVCSCENCGDRFEFWDTTHLFPQIHDRINNSTRCENVLLSYKGQFIVSAQRIRGVDKSIYRELHDAFVHEDSWAHQEEYLQGRPDSMSAPVFGYTVERIWGLLFQCNDMDVAWKCPTLLSGHRMGGSIEDCQCFDPPLSSGTAT